MTIAVNAIPAFPTLHAAALILLSCLIWTLLYGAWCTGRWAAPVLVAGRMTSRLWHAVTVSKALSVAKDSGTRVWHRLSHSESIRRLRGVRA